MTQSIRWGILGTGNIAKQFAKGVGVSKRGKLVAVGSRTEQSARGFAEAFKVPAAYASYSEVIDDKNVDAVYISLPNSMHYAWTLEAVRGGKHVLCEKPIATNAVQAEEMFAAANRAGVKLVEAFMYRSHPMIQEVVAKVRGGAIGQLKLVRSSFCYATKKVAGNIRYDRALAGGALMDIGCYCINFSRLLAGEPKQMTAYANLHSTGVDDMTAGVMQFPRGVLASFTCGMSLQIDNTAYISGSDGYIEIPVPWKPAADKAAYTIAHSTPPRMDSATATAPAAPPRQTFSIDGAGDMYALEADDFAATVLDGAPPRITRQDSVGNMRVLDELRTQIGLPITDDAQVSERS